MAKTLFNFGSVDDVAAAVDRFAPPDSTGKLKILRDSLLETLPNKKNVTTLEAADLVAFKLFSADLSADEIQYAVNRLFISNAYFAEMMRGIVANQIELYPKVSIDGKGQSVFVSESTPVTIDEAVSIPDAVVENVEWDEFANLSVGVDPALDDDKSVYVKVDGDGYKAIQESNDNEIEAAIVEKVVDDVVDFGQMNIPELKKYAKENNISLDGKTKKPEIIAKLIEDTQAQGKY